MAYKILIVEDNPAQVELMRITFSKKSNKFSTTFSYVGKECIKQCKENYYDAVILDYKLPDYSGLDVLIKLRKLNIRYPVIIITAQGDEKVAVEAMKNGAADYVIKEGNYLSSLPKVIEAVIVRERLQQQLRAKEEFLGSIVEKADDFIFSLDSEFNIQFVNPQISKLGYKEKEVLQKPFFILLSDRHDHASVSQILRQPSEGNYEFEFKDKKGKILNFVLSFSILQEKDSNQKIIGIAKDLTEILYLHRLIKESKKKLQAMFDGITDNILVFDLEKTVVMANEKVASLLNTTPEKVLGMECDKLVSLSLPVDEEVINRTFLSKSSEFSEISRNEKVFHVWTYPMFDLEGQLENIIEYSHDVTDQKNIERSLIQSEKLATIGLLASGVAHELRNPLNIIETARYCISDVLENGNDDINSKLEIIKRNVKRASNIINNLLEFSRHSPKDQERIDINKTIDKTLSLIEKDLHSQNIEVIKHYGSVQNVYLGLDSLKQVFLNIIINAIHAMPDGGVLQINTDLVDNWVKIKIGDTGYGIPKDHIKNIFTPFFPRKALGEGTGLGMYVSHSIIKREGGEISVTSTEGKGTVFTVKLPTKGKSC